MEPIEEETSEIKVADIIGEYKDSETVAKKIINLVRETDGPLWRKKIERADWRARNDCEKEINDLKTWKRCAEKQMNHADEKMDKIFEDIKELPTMKLGKSENNKWWRNLIEELSEMEVKI